VQVCPLSAENDQQADSASVPPTSNRDTFLESEAWKQICHGAVSVGASDLRGYCAKYDFPGHSLWTEETGKAHKVWLRNHVTEQVLDGLTKSVTADGRVGHLTGSEAKAWSFRYEDDEKKRKYTATIVDLELIFKRPATVPSNITRDDQTAPLQLTAGEDEVMLRVSATSLFDKDGNLEGLGCYHTSLKRKGGTAEWDAALDNDQ